MAAEKRCHYEVLGLPQTCTPDEIRSAYKKLALQRHPDKLIQSGTAIDDATAAFQELVQAYEVLSDPKERSWYDSHRSQILYASSSSSSNGHGPESPFPDLFSYFSPSCYTDYSNSKTGFFRVYGDVFDRVYRSEVSYCRKMGLNLGLVKEAPLMGDLGCDYSQVNAFYGYWLNFCTVMDFGWVNKWDAGAGLDRRSRRAMEEENKKVRKKAKKEFNETVRGLAEFVKKRDKRVIDMMVRKEREREEKRKKEIAKKKEREREKLERARMYEEPEWARVEEVEEDEEEAEKEEEEQKKEFYCVVCGKKFKSDKQWKNHEQSKKHKEKVAELKKYEDEDKAEDEDEVEDEAEAENEAEVEAEQDMNDEYENDNGHSGFVSAEEDVDELEEKFKDSVELQEGKGEDEIHSDDEDNLGNPEEPTKLDESVGIDDESSILEAMLSGRRNRKHVTMNPPKGSFASNHVQSDDEMETMEYNNKKGKKKSRRAKKGKANVSEAEASGGGDDDTNIPGEGGLDGSDVANSSGHDDQANHGAQSSTKGGRQHLEKKGTSRRDAETKPKNSSKGRKQKEKSKNSDPVCEKCGEEFDTRNKLYKHLSETGHASLKFR